MTNIDQAFVLAAGFAKRMRPLTDHLPKPLVKLNGKPLLGHILDHLQAEGVKRVVVNGHHCLDVLRDYITTANQTYAGMDIILSEETDILETGGGAVQALPYLDADKPFYMINGDAYWVNPQDQTTLSCLADIWDDTAMDMVMLLQNAGAMTMTKGVGDYNITGNQCIRSKNQNGTHMFTGVRIVHPRALQGYQAECFSFLKIMDAVEATGRLYAVDHQGEWYHISTPADLAEVETNLFGSAA